jgi:hypothetical protein
MIFDSLLFRGNLLSEVLAPFPIGMFRLILEIESPLLRLGEVLCFFRLAGFRPVFWFRRFHNPSSESAFWFHYRSKPASNELSKVMKALVVQSERLAITGLHDAATCWLSHELQTKEVSRPARKRNAQVMSLCLLGETGAS